MIPNLHTFISDLAAVILRMESMEDRPEELLIQTNNLRLVVESYAAVTQRYADHTYVMQDSDGSDHILWKSESNFQAIFTKVFDQCPPGSNFRDNNDRINSNIKNDLLDLMLELWVATKDICFASEESQTSHVAGFMDTFIQYTTRIILFYQSSCHTWSAEAIIRSLFAQISAVKAAMYHTSKDIPNIKQSVFRNSLEKFKATLFSESYSKIDEVHVNWKKIHLDKFNVSLSINEGDVLAKCPEIGLDVHGRFVRELEDRIYEHLADLTEYVHFLLHFDQIDRSTLPLSEKTKLGWGQTYITKQFGEEYLKPQFGE